MGRERSGERGVGSAEGELQVEVEIDQASQRTEAYHSSK